MIIHTHAHIPSHFYSIETVAPSLLSQQLDSTESNGLLRNSEDTYFVNTNTLVASTCA